MKDRIGITIVALVSLLISCFFVAGCIPPPGYIAIDSGSKLMNPTFGLYGDQYFQKRLRIGGIKVEKVLYSSEHKKRSELDVPLQEGRQTVWELRSTFPDTDRITVALWGWLTTPTVSSLTYGKVPRGYAEKVKALPLEPEQLYSVEMGAYVSRGIAPLRFMIRLSETDIPDRLEYSWGIPFYMWADIFDQTRAHLNLD